MSLTLMCGIASSHYKRLAARIFNTEGPGTATRVGEKKNEAGSLSDGGARRAAARPSHRPWRGQSGGGGDAGSGAAADHGKSHRFLRHPAPGAGAAGRLRHGGAAVSGAAARAP